MFAYRKTLIRRDRSGERCAACWLLGSISPGPLTKDLFETPRGSAVDARMGAPSGRGGRGGSGDTTRPEKSPVGKVWTSKAIQELLKQHEQDAAKATKPSKLPRLLLNFTEETIAVLEMVETLELVTDPGMIALYVESEEKRGKWFEEKGKEFVPTSRRISFGCWITRRARGFTVGRTTSTA